MPKPFKRYGYMPKAFRFYCCPISVMAALKFRAIEPAITRHFAFLKEPTFGARTKI